MTEGCRSATKYCDVYAGLTRYRDLRKPYDLPVLPVPLFEHELYGVGLFALAAGDVHDRLRHRFVERVARFERHFLHQDQGEERTMDQTLDLGWKLLTILPRGELDRVDPKTLDAHYVEGAWENLGTGGSWPA